MSAETECDALIRQLGGTVVQFGRKDKRTSNTHGIPDRLYFLKGQMVYFEVKSRNDYLTAPQILFLMMVWSHGGVGGCGNRDDLCALLNAPNARKVGFDLVTKYSTRAGRSAKASP